MSTKRITVSVNAETVERLKELQNFLKLSTGMDTTMTQVIDYLVWFHKERRDAECGITDEGEQQ